MTGPRKSRSAGPSPPAKTLVLDNGAYTIKAGFATDVAAEGATPRIIPNCIARDRQKKIYVGSGLERCQDLGEVQFRRPVDKGFIVNWEAQKEIWDREFFDEKAPLKCDADETRLILSEQPNSLPALQSNCDQIVFEEYGFASCYRALGPTLHAYADIQSIFQTPSADEPCTNATPIAAAASPPRTPAEIVMVVDSGYSHTTVTPLLNGRPLHQAVRRLDVGGKLLTNHLTRLLSMRHFDMRNDVYIVNDIKEAACYVSLDFAGDLDKMWKGTRGERRPDYLSGAGIAKDYVLPDFHARRKGIVRDYDAEIHKVRKRGAAAEAGGEASPTLSNEDIITLRNERFAVPEVLFHPTDIGLRQPGLAQLVMQSLGELPVGLWPGLLANVVVVGGNTLLPGLVDRLRRELVQLAPDDCVVRVARPADPLAHAWLGGAGLARHADVEGLCVSKAEYEEHGAAWVSRRFAQGLPLD